MHEIAEFLKDWWELIAFGLSAIGGAAGVVHRWLIRPRLARARAFLARVDETIATVARMDTAWASNGGSSLADTIHRTAALAARAAVLSAKNEARLTTVLDFIECPTFEADKDGEWIRVNRAFELLFGSQQNMTGRGWINVIAQGVRESVVREWLHAVQDRRAFVSPAQCLTLKGTTIEVRIRTKPVPGDTSGEVLGWIGELDVVQA